MKRMERLERAVAEIQRALVDLGTFTPSPDLDLVKAYPKCEHEIVDVVIDRRNVGQCAKCGQIFHSNVSYFHKGHFYPSGEQMPEEVEIQ